MLGRVTAPIIRNFTTSAIRRSHYPGDGVPGENLPFSIKNKYALTAGFLVYAGSAMAIPFIAVRFQLLK